MRNQFRNHPGIMDYTEKPDYAAVVDICTKDSLRELATPGILAILTPIDDAVRRPGGFADKIPSPAEADDQTMFLHFVGQPT